MNPGFPSDSLGGQQNDPPADATKKICLKNLFRSGESALERDTPKIAGTFIVGPEREGEIPSQVDGNPDTVCVGKGALYVTCVHQQAQAVIADEAEDDDDAYGYFIKNTNCESLSFNFELKFIVKLISLYLHLSIIFEHMYDFFFYKIITVLQ
jgi:hypothetical protein